MKKDLVNINVIFPLTLICWGKIFQNELIFITSEVTQKTFPIVQEQLLKWISKCGILKEIYIEAGRVHCGKFDFAEFNIGKKKIRFTSRRKFIDPHHR